MQQAALASISAEELKQLDPHIAEDFLALGTVYLQTELLTRHMRNYSHLDEALMLGELLAGAKAALQGEHETARQHLRRCFEMLLDCREKFYPVDCYLIDICLMIPRLADEKFEQLLREDIPTNWLAQGTDWAEILREKPALKELIAEGWKHSRLELLGGDWQEGPQSLMSLEANIDNLQRGKHWYVEQFGRAPVVWGRKRFGHGPHVPQLLSRLNYTGALHFIMDDGIYPDEELAKLRWQGSDGSTLDACSRIPVAGDSASGWLRFAKRMAESMDRDHSAGIFVARWPEMRTPWLNDLRKAARYAPVLGKFVLLESFFRATDTHGPLHEFKAGEYLSPTLIHTVARREADPISRYTKYWQREWEFRTWDWCAAVTELFSTERCSKRFAMLILNPIPPSSRLPSPLSRKQVKLFPQD
jgi:alpha-mannosidase